MKKKSAIIYTLTLGIFTVAVLFAHLSRGGRIEPRDGWLFLIVALIIAGTAECMIVRMPRYGVIPVADLVYYVAMALGTAVSSGAVALGAGVFKGVYSLVARRKDAGYGFFFLIQAPLTFFLGGLLFHSISLEGNFAGDFYRSFRNIGALFFTALFCLVARHIFNGAYLAFLEQVKWSYVWRFQPHRIQLYLLTIVPIAVLVIITYQVNPLALALLTPPLALVFFSIKRYADLLFEAKTAMEILAEAVEARDPHMVDHGDRVARYSREIGRRLQLPPEMIQHLESAARMHDLGKVSIADEILVKLDSLSSQEREEINKHSQFGGDVTGRLSFCREESIMIRHHHERFDGKGYPDGLSGDDIPLGSRIIAVAEAFDTLTTSRSYSGAVTFGEALKEIEKSASTQFDPEVVRALSQVIKSRVDKFG